MENFLNLIAHLESSGAVSAKWRPLICEHVAKVLRDARDLGLTRPGEPAAGLPDMFALRSVDIRPRMVDVARTRRPELFLDGHAHELADRRRELEERRLRPRRDVQHGAARARRLGREQISVDDVLDEREVARLRAVAVDQHRLVRRDSRDEQRNDRCVL